MAINRVMSEKCDFCGKVFDKLSQLYMHKQSHTPNLLLHQHSHPAFGMDINQATLKREADDQYLPVTKQLQVVKKSSDESDFEPSFYNKGKKLKRKRGSDDEDQDSTAKRFREKDEDNSGFEVIPYDRNESKIRRGKIKKKKLKGRKLKEILDKDGELDLEIDNAPDRESKSVEIYSPDYELNAEKEQQNNKQLIRNLNRVIEDTREECANEIEEEKEKCRDTLLNIKKLNKERLTELKEEHKEKLDEKMLQKDKRHKDEISRITEKFEDEMKEKDKKWKEMEKEFEERINNLNNLLDSKQEDEAYLTPLAQAIFNCTTMEEIFEIKNLIENYKVNELTVNHFKTLQNMFLSLSYGVLPICQPQRDNITDSQRELVGKIRNSSFVTAKGLLRENREQIANLFSIVGDSLKLARNSFNRYGFNNEGDKRKS